MAEKLQIKNKIEGIYSQLALDLELEQGIDTTLKNLKKQLEDLKEVQATERKEINTLFQSKKMLDQSVKMSYATIVKICQLAQNKKITNSNDLKKLLLIDTILRPSLKNLIIKKSKKLQISSVIDRSLVDTFVAQKEENSTSLARYFRLSVGG